ncbi:MAG: hypothetical protein IKX02_04425, partial [Spirochaetales bacterium]|nr:hypothetical protein [Spirochaetales bacterium]
MTKGSNFCFNNVQGSVNSLVYFCSFPGDNSFTVESKAAGAGLSTVFQPEKQPLPLCREVPECSKLSHSIGGNLIQGMVFH